MNRLKPLSIKEIVPYVNSVPKRIDVPITELQNSISEIIWMEKSFGRAVVSRKIQNEQEYIYPSCFVAEGYDHANLLLNDNWDAYSFMLATGVEEIVDYIEETRNTFEREVDLIVWLNLERIQDRRDIYIEELKDEVINKIKTTRFRSVEPELTVLDCEVIRIEDRAEEIFREFSLKLAESKYLFYPYGGFRITMNITFIEGC